MCNTARKQYNKVHLTVHARQRCKQRGFTEQQVIAECRRMPKVNGEMMWDNGIFKMKVNGNGEKVTVITVFKTDKRIRDTRNKRPLTKKIRA